MSTHWFSAIPLTLACVALQSASAQTTIDANRQSAHAANAGWIQLRPDRPAAPAGIVFGESFLAGFAYGTNIGWIDFGNGNNP